LTTGFKVAIYPSDISGAFDKVDREILMDRLRRTGLSEGMIIFLYDYLASRSARVVVQGYESESFEISNQIFQGTVLGPPLWNVFFRPVDEPIRACRFKGAKFADDLTAYKNFDAHVPNEAIKHELKECQHDVHTWGVQNRVTFDAGKEHFCILHKLHYEGEAFKLLGVLLDPQLTMADEIRRVRNKAAPKIHAILASRYVYSKQGLMQQYKSHILCLLEFSNVAFSHAAHSHLKTLDALQDGFLRELGIEQREAFTIYNLAPLHLRRDIAVLGLLHKIQLGQTHPDFAKLFPLQVEARTANTRQNSRRHERQFHEFAGHSHYFKRSVFGAVKVYNTLQPEAVRSTTVKHFQSLLTREAKCKCQLGCTDWANIYRYQPW